MPTHPKWSEERLEHWSTQAVLTGFSQVLDSMRLDADAEPIAFEVVVPGDDEELNWTAALWREARGDLAPDAVLGLGCSVETLQAFAQLVLGKPPSTPDEAREIYSELLNQSLSVLSAEASSRLGRTIDMGVAEPGDRPSDAVDPVQIRFTVNDETFGVVVVPNTAWADAVFAGPSEETAREAPEDGESDSAPEADGGDVAGSEILAALAAQQSQAGAMGGSSLQDATPSVDADLLRNLERLMDIDMEVAISFGETTLLLADVLKLSSGAIVELNRAVSDSVELLVNDSVIAQGEVVVVEGNYGIRVTHVVSPQERVNLI